jgi:hypothetical protein
VATFEQEEHYRLALRGVLDQLLKIQPDSLVRVGDLGKELSFEAGVPVFQRTLDVFRNLADCNLDTMPYEVLSQLTSTAQQALQYFDQIQKFSVEQHPSNPKQVRDNLINQLRDQWGTYYNQITPHIAYSTRRGTDFDALEREARGTLTLLKQIATGAKVDREKTLAEMQAAL